MKKINMRILLIETYTLDLTIREWLVYSWIKMGKPNNLRKFMTGDNSTLCRTKTKLYKKGYLAKSDFKKNKRNFGV